MLYACRYEFAAVPFIQDYILSFRYQEEHTKATEETNYKMSLAIEPRDMPATRGESLPSTPAAAAGAQPHGGGGELAAGGGSGAKPAKPAQTLHDRMNAEFKRGHRKTRSLGNTMSMIWGQGGSSEGKGAPRPKSVAKGAKSPRTPSLTEPEGRGSVGKKRSSYNMLDDGTSSDGSTSGASDASDPGALVELDAADIAPPAGGLGGAGGPADAGAGAAATRPPSPPPLIQGSLQRKSESKLKGFKREWVVLRASEILLFKKRGGGGKGHDRARYCTDQCKRHSTVGCVIVKDRGDSRKLALKLASGKTLTLKMNSVAERDRWSLCLRTTTAAYASTQGSLSDSEALGHNTFPRRSRPAPTSLEQGTSPRQAAMGRHVSSTQMLLSPLRVEWRGPGNVKGSRSHDSYVPVRGASTCSPDAVAAPGPPDLGRLGETGTAANGPAAAENKCPAGGPTAPEELP